jgi:hypothetical protein
MVQSNAGSRVWLPLGFRSALINKDKFISREIGLEGTKLALDSGNRNRM